MSREHVFRMIPGNENEMLRKIFRLMQNTAASKITRIFTFPLLQNTETTTLLTMDNLDEGQENAQTPAAPIAQDPPDQMMEMENEEDDTIAGAVENALPDLDDALPGAVENALPDLDDALPGAVENALPDLDDAIARAEAALNAFLVQMDAPENEVGAGVPGHGGLFRGRGFRARPHRPRRQRPTYTEAQKRRAVELLDMGLSCRTVAATLGPHCSSGTPIRWRQKFRAAEHARLGLAAIVREAGLNPDPLPNEIIVPRVQINRPVAPPRPPGPPPRRIGAAVRRRRQPLNRVRRF